MDKEFEKVINEIREDIKQIKSDVKNLTDETSRDYVQALIDNVNKGNLSVGDFLEKPSNETDEQLYLEHWTCDICGKHTHKVEYDYLGNGTNHLSCELKHEIAAMEAGVDVKKSKESN